MYNLPEDILSTLKPRDELAEDLPGEATVPSSDRASSKELGADNVVGSKACSLCGVAFPTVEDQRGHIRSDLHGYNLKQKIRGGSPVTEAEFEKLVGGMMFAFLIFRTPTDACQI